MKSLKQYLFIGEERSERAKQMGVTWKDGRLSASHLFKALEHTGISLEQCAFMNVFEDDINKIALFDGVRVAMGRKVQRELDKHQIAHISIIHPAARGKIRIIDNYINHVKERLSHEINT